MDSSKKYCHTDMAGSEERTEPYLNDVKIIISVDDDCSAEDYDCYNDEQIHEFLRGEWWFIGVQAQAQILVPIGHTSASTRCAQIVTLHSSGVWGIESDSDLVPFAEDQIADLKELLEKLCVGSVIEGLDAKSIDALYLLRANQEK